MEDEPVDVELDDELDIDEDSFDKYEMGISKIEAEPNLDPIIIQAAANHIFLGEPIPADVEADMKSAEIEAAERYAASMDEDPLLQVDIRFPDQEYLDQRRKGFERWCRSIASELLVKALISLNCNALFVGGKRVGKAEFWEFHFNRLSKFYKPISVEPENERGYLSERKPVPAEVANRVTEPQGGISPEYQSVLETSRFRPALPAPYEPEDSPFAWDGDIGFCAWCGEHTNGTEFCSSYHRTLSYKKEKP